MVPLPAGRSSKPRRSGLTMIVDQGLPLAQQADLLRLGFAAIEISDNVVPLSSRERKAQIRAARSAGLVVYGEVGSKKTLSNPKLLVAQAEDCFAAGAALVLVEAAELVRKGRPNRRTLDLIVKNLDLRKIMIELPGPWIPEVRKCDIEVLKKLLVEELGPDVNLANVVPEDLLDLETTRVGLGVAGPPKSLLR